MMRKRVVRALGIIVLTLVFLFAGIQFWIETHKQEFFEKVNTALKSKIDGDLEIGDFSFTPFSNGLGITFTLHNVKLHDSRFSVHKTELLAADRISISLNPGSIFSEFIRIKNIRVESGTVRMFVQRDGYSNWMALAREKKEDDESSSGGAHDHHSLFNRIRRVTFENLNFLYIDSLHAKKFSFKFLHTVAKTQQSGDLIRGSLEGDIHFGGLTFKAPGMYLKDQVVLCAFDVEFNKLNRKLTLAPSQLRLKGNNKINLEGWFDVGTKPLRWAMDIKTQGIPAAFALKLLPERINRSVSRFKILPVTDGHVVLGDSLGTRNPGIKVTFQTDTFQYKFPFGTLYGMKAKGFYTNQYDSSRAPSHTNSRIEGTEIEGFFEKMPLSVKLTVDNFISPDAEMKCSLSADPKAINQMLDPRRYRVKNGFLKLNLLYRGEMKKLYNAAENKLEGKIWGDLAIDDAELQYFPQNVNLKKLNTRISFTEKSIFLKNMSLYDGMNDLKINGQIEGLILALSGSPSPPKATVSIYIPTWKLNWLSVLLDRKTTPRNLDTKSYQLSKLADDAIDNIEISGNILSDKLIFNKLSAEKVRFDMDMKRDSFIVNNLSMNAFGGQVQLSGFLKESVGNKTPFFKVSASIRDTKVSSVFYSFNNFGQSALTDKNLSGVLNSDLKFSSNLNKDASIITKSMKGDVRIDLREARIVNFLPFLKIKKLFLKSRSLEDVKFAPLVQSYSIEGEEILVKKTEIESNVVTLFVDGIYSFGDKTDMVVQIPFKNIQKRDANYRFEKHFPNDMKSVYLRAKQEGEEVVIRLDHEFTDKKNKAVKKRD